jgi:hypothetical protein
MNSGRGPGQQIEMEEYGVRVGRTRGQVGHAALGERATVIHDLVIRLCIASGRETGQ